MASKYSILPPIQAKTHKSAKKVLEYKNQRAIDPRKERVRLQAKRKFIARIKRKRPKVAMVRSHRPRKKKRLKWCVSENSLPPLSLKIGKKT